MSPLETLIEANRTYADVRVILRSGEVLIGNLPSFPVEDVWEIVVIEKQHGITSNKGVKFAATDVQAAELLR